MFAEPESRTIELRLESSICKHCGTVIERFLACEADRSWHHARTGELGCPHRRSAMRSRAVELVLLPPLDGDDQSEAELTTVGAEAGTVLQYYDDDVRVIAPFFDAKSDGPVEKVIEETPASRCSSSPSPLPGCP